VKSPQKALITTAYGQDSIYLGRLLRSNGYEVLVLNHKNNPPDNHGHFDQVATLSFTQTSEVLGVIETFKPSEIYNLAAISSVAESWKVPSLAMEVNGRSVERLLDGLLNSRNATHLKFFQAGSTDMVGKEIISSNESDFSPWSPYGESKDYARRAVVAAREQSGLWAINGILTNHDSRFRKRTFVIPLIANQIVDVIQGRRGAVVLENPLISRDWAHAEDIMAGAWKMIQALNPIDLTLATGTSLSLQDLVKKCSEFFNLDLPIEIQKSHHPRKSDFTSICVEATKAQDLIGWSPKFVGASTLIELVQIRIMNSV
jgi:GDPmannose 4,6-dehydratase